MPQQRTSSRPSTHLVDLSPKMLRRGFWLYVWRVKVGRKYLHYVGRTGDASSPKAASPYQRMGQHLGRQKNQTALRNHLRDRSIDPEDCSKLEFICHGPIHPEAANADMIAHMPIRDAVGALERQLAKALHEAGYVVMNEFKVDPDHDRAEWRKVVRAFSPYFPKLEQL